MVFVSSLWNFSVIVECREGENNPGRDNYRDAQAGDEQRSKRGYQIWSSLYFIGFVLFQFFESPGIFLSAIEVWNSFVGGVCMWSLWFEIKKRWRLIV